MKSVAIMQPTYLPWAGYFDLIDSCDTFVFLDCVQFDRRSWQQRNRIKTAAGELLLTVPVLVKNRREQKIREVEIDSSRGFAQQHLSSIHHAYSKAPFYKDYAAGLESILRKDRTLLADLNIELIGWISEIMGVKTPTLRSSTLPARGSKVERLLSICEALGADRYVSAAGSRDYIEENNLFEQHGIQVTYQAYTHPSYRQQHGDFVSHLSALDVLFNEGPAALSIVRSGRAA
jgi:hypothetical protein